jgi:hypothetical protein
VAARTTPDDRLDLAVDRLQKVVLTREAFQERGGGGEDADVLTEQNATALLDQMIGVGLDLVGLPRGDQLPHPPGVHVDAQAGTAERGRRTLQHIAHEVGSGGSDGQPLGAQGQSMGPQTTVHLFRAVPHPVVELDDTLGCAGRPAAVENVQQPGPGPVALGMRSATRTSRNSSVISGKSARSATP